MAMHTFTFVLFFFILFWAKLPAQEPCPVECSCTNMDTKFSVFCQGRSIVNITQKVPSQATLYHYKALEIEVDLGSTNFSHLTSLESLRLSSTYDNNDLNRKIMTVPLNQQRLFWPLQNLKELHVNINWKLNVSLPELFSNFDHLETLDLSTTRMLLFTNLITSFKGFRNSASLRVLNLHNIQTFEHQYNGFLLNISELLESLAAHKLEELDISYNALRTVIPGLIRYAPNLKILKVNNNMLIPIFTSAFGIEAILHPSLIKADVSEQGLGENVKSSASDNAMDILNDMEKKQQLQLMDTRTLFVESQHPQLLSLFNENCFKLSRQSMCQHFVKRM